MAETYEEAVMEAKAALKDARERGEEAIDEDWEQVRKELFTPLENAESDLRASLMCELAEAKREGINRKKLGEVSSVQQAVIKRMENDVTRLRIRTLLKVLVPLGLKLDIVPLEDDDVATEDDIRAHEEAMEEYRRGECIPLEKILRCEEERFT